MQVGNNQASLYVLTLFNLLVSLSYSKPFQGPQIAQHDDLLLFLLNDQLHLKAAQINKCLHCTWMVDRCTIQLLCLHRPTAATFNTMNRRAIPDLDPDRQLAPRTERKSHPGECPADHLV